jgi:hypothetical protein
MISKGDEEIFPVLEMQFLKITAHYKPFLKFKRNIGIPEKLQIKSTIKLIQN